MTKRTAVIGSGVIGLTSALRLAEAGFEPQIIAREASAATTSSVAAAFWYPYKVGANPAVSGWAMETYREYFTQLERGVPGVRFVRLREYFPSSPPLPWWKEILSDFRALPDGELPSGIQAAYEYSVPLAETSRYLPWLEAEVHRRDIPIHLRTVSSLSDVSNEFDIIVNCAGAWGGQIARDEMTYPISGQVQIVTSISSSQPEVLILCTDDDVTYIVRRSTDCVLGGTAREGDWNLSPDIAVASEIRARCERLEPNLAGASVIANRVGLRPGRDEVRLEAVILDTGARVIHNYGHGGAGYTLCWGCADSVGGLAKACAR